MTGVGVGDNVRNGERDKTTDANDDDNGGGKMRILLGFLGSCVLLAMLANALAFSVLIVRAVVKDRAQRYAETHNKRRRI